MATLTNFNKDNLVPRNMKCVEIVSKNIESNL